MSWQAEELLEMLQLASSKFVIIDAALTHCRHAAYPERLRSYADEQRCLHTK